MGLPTFGNEKVITFNDRNPLTEQKIADSVKSSLLDKTAIAPTRLVGISKTLLGYPSGTPVIVTYYSKHNPFTNMMSNNASFSLEQGAVQSSYTLIHDFEMTQIGEMDITQNPETGEMEASGQAVLYPGFKPNYGDLFLFNMGDGLVGLFIVNEIQRAAIYQASYHIINYHLTDLNNADIFNKLKAATIREMHFIKEKYLSDEVSLVGSEGYKQLNILNEFRADLLETFFSENYIENSKSIFVVKDYYLIKRSGISDTSSPIEVYDPYIVEFLNNKTSIMERKPIRQLASDIVSITNQSGILHAILTGNVNSLNRMWVNPLVLTFKTFSVGITSLINNSCYYLLENEKDIPAGHIPMYLRNVDGGLLEPYIFSNKFYIALFREFHHKESLANKAIEIEQMDQAVLDALRANAKLENINDSNTYFIDEYGLSQFELLVLNFVAKNHLPDIVEFLSQYRDTFPYKQMMTDAQKFYYVPILLHFIDYYLEYIK